jgi:hypothetical protein
MWVAYSRPDGAVLADAAAGGDAAAAIGDAAAAVDEGDAGSVVRRGGLYVQDLIRQQKQVLPVDASVQPADADHAQNVFRELFSFILSPFNVLQLISLASACRSPCPAEHTRVYMR